MIIVLVLLRKPDPADPERSSHATISQSISTRNEEENRNNTGLARMKGFSYYEVEVLNNH